MYVSVPSSRQLRQAAENELLHGLPCSVLALCIPPTRYICIQVCWVYHRSTDYKQEKRIITS